MSLTDTLGSLAVATKGQYMTGVSVDIGTSFVKPAGRVGDELTATAVITALGHLLNLKLSTHLLIHIYADRAVSRVHSRRLLQCPGSACRIRL